MNQKLIDAERELYGRLIDASRSNLRAFVTTTYSGYSWNWHHERIANKLDQFAKGGINNLMLFVPPQHGKTELGSRQLAAYMLGRSPSLKIAGCSYSADLARKNNRLIQRIIESKRYAEIFPETKLFTHRLKDKFTGNWVRNTDEFEIVGAGGSYKSVGVLGPLTGNTVDVAIIDDPIKDRLQANSSTYRQRVWDWYTDVLETRLHNDSQVLLIMTRWHEDDLAGRLLQKQPDKWEVISIPAVKENNDDPEDPREIGEALWPEKHSKEKILKLKELNPITFSALMQQRPSPEEGGIIKPDEWFSIIKDCHESFVTHFKVDTSYTADKRNDPTAIMAYSTTPNGIVIKRCVARHVEFNDLCHFVVDFCNANGYTNASTVAIEPKASGKTAVQELLRRTNLNVFEAPSPKDSKITRARIKAGYMASGRVSVVDGPWVDGFFDELKSFPNGAHDDMVDVLLMAIDDSNREGDDIIWTDDFL